jgi:hypothetical protein
MYDVIENVHSLSESESSTRGMIAFYGLLSNKLPDPVDNQVDG